jgi:hypothetical protein
VATHGTLGRRIIFSSGGSPAPLWTPPTLVQVAHSTAEDTGATFGVATTPGNLVAAILTSRGNSNPIMNAATGSWTSLANAHANVAGGDGVAAQAQIVGAGATIYTSDSGSIRSRVACVEIAGAAIADISSLSLGLQAFSTDFNLGSFAAVSTDDILLMGFTMYVNGNASISISGSSYGWTTDDQGYALGSLDHPYAWVGHRHGLGAAVQARATESGGTGSGDNTWAGVAMRVTGIARAF